MTTATAIPIQLDRTRHLQFTQRALFRMGSLPAPFEFEDLSKPRKSYAALVAWLWACLSPADAADFPGPEDLAALIAPDREKCRLLAGSLADAINAGTRPEKNEHSSTPEISRSSS